MHIPDGFLNTEVLISTNVVSAVFLFVSIKKVNKYIHPREIPLMGVLASFIFVIQLLAFPVFGGTSVHLTGGVLAMVLLGPFSGLLIISCALIMHALLFQHGGVLTLGANILNIGVVNCVLGYYVYKMIPKAGLAWAGVVTWMGVITGAVFCTLELAFSNRLSPGVPVLSMAITYSIAGLIEGLMTFSILTGIKKIRPDSLNLKKV